MKKLLLPLFLGITLLFNLSNSTSIENDTKVVYKIKKSKATVRNAPEFKASTIATIHKGDVVVLLEKTTDKWWKVAYDEEKVGYVYTPYLEKELLLRGEDVLEWKKINMEAYRDMIDCYGVDEKFDYDIENFVSINVSVQQNVIVKLIDETTKKCIRVAYVQSGKSAKMGNIPKGNYYLKVAYGNDLRSKIKDNWCSVKFMTDARYEQGRYRLSFNKEKVMTEKVGTHKEKTYYKIPTYDFNLNPMGLGDAHSNFAGKKISAEEFYD